MRASNEDLVRRCREGDDDAWKELVDSYAALVYSVPRRYGLEAALAEDVFADTWLALVRALPSLRDPQALPQWLIRTATRATWETARKAKAALASDLPELTGGAPPEELVNTLEEAQLVREGLAALPDRCRTLLELLYFKAPALSYDAIAAKLDMPRGSLGPTRRRCLDKLRRLLPPHLGGK